MEARDLNRMFNALAPTPEQEQAGLDRLLQTERKVFPVKKLKKFPINTTDAYLMGMFSTLEYMIDATIEEILIDIPIVQEVKDALISKEGKAGRLYELILLYERAEWSEIKPIAEELGIKTNEMAQMYMECVDEVNDIWENVVGNVEKP